MPERPVHIVKGFCAGCTETVVATHGTWETGYYHADGSCACGPITPHAYVRGGSYPRLNVPHPPKVSLPRNALVQVLHTVGERWVQVRALDMPEHFTDHCLVPRAELSAERWQEAEAAEPWVEQIRRRA
jgi:hypothetical protein